MSTHNIVFVEKFEKCKQFLVEKQTCYLELWFKKNRPLSSVSDSFLKVKVYFDLKAEMLTYEMGYL